MRFLSVGVFVNRDFFHDSYVFPDRPFRNQTQSSLERRNSGYDIHRAFLLCFPTHHNDADMVFDGLVRVLFALCGRDCRVSLPDGFMVLQGL